MDKIAKKGVWCLGGFATRSFFFATKKKMIKESNDHTYHSHSGTIIALTH